MQLSRPIVAALSAITIVGLVPTAASAASGGDSAQRLAATGIVTAMYEMNEPGGATVMHDSSGNGLDGVIDPTGIQTGAVFSGATGYNWVRRPPTTPPASPERVIQVSDNLNLEPGDQDFTVEIRYRTKEKFGNIIQKGQAQSKGGQWKIQNPKGIPSCLFKGPNGRVATGAKTPLNDNQWHTLTCVLTSTSVTLYVDGVQRNKKNGSTGTIDNKIPMTIGGKIECDQITVTCDYFSGQIDYVQITKGSGSQAPPPPTSGPDTVPPNATVNSPTTNQVLANPVVTFSGAATDNQHVSRVRLAVQNRDAKTWLRSDGTLGKWMYLDATLSADTGTSVTWSYVTPSLPPGRYKANVIAIDDAGLKDPTKAKVAFTVG